MPTSSAITAERKPEAKSRIGNGKALFLDTPDGEPIDGRSLPARVFRDTLESILSDLGGRAAISEGEYQLARRVASLSVGCLVAESKQAAGHEIDLEDYVRSVNALNRTLGNLGLKRRARDVTPDLKSYIEGQAPA